MKYLAECVTDCMCQINGSDCFLFFFKKEIIFTLKEIFCCSYSLGLFSPTYESQCSYFSTILVILENKFSLMTHVYIKTICWILSSCLDLLEITEMRRLITILNIMIGYYLVFLLRKGQNSFTICKNFPVDNLFIAVWPLVFFQIKQLDFKPTPMK